ncbi:hypothetical protein HDV00_007063 [Rhizophlyctis rosea]|nr:hypothetical protein HDV00_007063 [Rhizophlyctis rosea]
MDSVAAAGADSKGWFDGADIVGEEPSRKAILMSFLVIVVSEIGDKTFFIAAVMAMRSPRVLILSAAMGALLVMTVLSAFMGHVVPNLISKKHTQMLAALLFLVFGVRMLWDAYHMTGDEGQEELEEVVQEIEGEEQAKKDEDMELGEVEKGDDEDADEDKKPMMRKMGDIMSKEMGKARRGKGGLREGCMNLANLLFSPIWIQAFVLTFLAEWGDRSQIATVAMAGAEDFWWVTIGSVAGHLVCSSIAVIGGRMLAQRISVKTVTYVGGVLFLVFAVTSFHNVFQMYQEAA